MADELEMKESFTFLTSTDNNDYSFEYELYGQFDKSVSTRKLFFMMLIIWIMKF